jgi:hypothetical protein
MNLITLSILFLFSSTTYAQESVISQLSKQELELINKNEFVIKETKIKDRPWPEVTLYSVINASALESIALFSAFDKQKDYIPGLLQSSVVKQVNPVEIHTQYKMNMPWPLSDAVYIHGSVLGRLKKNLSSYYLKWYLVSSNVHRSVKGEAIFESYGKKTIMRYKSLIHPKSVFASLIKSTMMKDLKSSLMATKEYIENTSTKQRVTTNKYCKKVLDGLGGKFVW